METRIDKNVVWEQIWPAIQELIRVAAAENTNRIKRLLLPGSEAAMLFELFGLSALDITLKMVLGLEKLGLARVIESDAGQIAHVECAWLEAEQAGGTYSPSNVITIRLRQHRKRWRIEAINPAAADQPLTELSAQQMLVSSGLLQRSDQVSLEPWVLPIAFYAGALQLPIDYSALEDTVEALALPGLQERGYGVLSIISARRLWRDFAALATPKQTEPSSWAGAVEYLLSELTLRKTSPAEVAQSHDTSRTRLVERVEQIRQTLKIAELDQRYSPLAIGRVVLEDDRRAPPMP